MNLKIKQSALADALKKVRLIAPKPGDGPALSSVLMEAGKSLRLTAANSESRLSLTVEADIKMAGSLLLPTARLSGVVERMRGGDVTIKGDEKGAEIKGAGVSARLLGLSPAEFPAENVPLDESKDFEISADLLRDIIERLNPAIGADRGRPALMGMHLCARGEFLVAESADGSRLHVYETDVKVDSLINCIIPQAALRVLTGAALTGSVLVRAHESCISIRSEELRFQSQLLNMLFPQTSGIIPPISENVIIGSCADLISALETASVIQTHDTVKIVATKKGINLRSETAEAGSVEAFIEREQIIGAEFFVSPTSLRDSIKALKLDTARIEFIDSRSPISLREDGFTSVVMIKFPPSAPAKTEKEALAK